MNTPTEDVKKTTSSSSSSDVTTETSSVSTETTNGANPTTDVKEPTLAEVAQKAYDASVAEQADSSSEEKASDESGVLSSNKTEEKSSEQEESDESKTEEEKVDEKNPVPYDRFREVNEAKQQIEKKLQEVEPLVQAQQSIVSFCEQHNISEEQFINGMNMLKLINTDPIAAKKELEPIWNQLSGLSGDVLPSDIKQMVDDGVIPVSVGKELAAARGREKVTSEQSKLLSQRTQQQEQKRTLNAINSAIGSWSKSKQQLVPDFKPKSGPNAKDGMYEFFADRLYKVMVTRFPKTEAEAIQLAESAFAEVSDAFSQFKRSATTSKGISSTKSSTNSKQAPNSIAEVIQATLAKHGA